MLTKMLMVLGVLLIGIGSASAQAGCKPYPDIKKYLEKGKYKEKKHARGILANGSAFMQIYTNDDTGSWTFILIFPGGNTCMGHVGYGWEIYEKSDPA